jgi:hypothetical protein
MEFVDTTTKFGSYFSNYNGDKRKCEHKNVFVRAPAPTESGETDAFGLPLHKVLHQLCFVLDLTGSMQSLIDSVKREIVPMIEALRSEALVAVLAFENTENYCLDFQVALVGYRDFDDVKQFEVHDFTSDVEKIKTFLGTLFANGGNDAPEDVKGAFIHALFGLDDDCGHRLSWETESASKSVYLITDAPAHGRKFHTQGVVGDNYLNDSETEWRDILKQMNEEVISFNIIKINQAISTMCGEFERLCGIAEVKCNVLDISQNINANAHVTPTSFGHRGAHLEGAIMEMDGVDLLDPTLTLTSSTVMREVSICMRETSGAYVSKGHRRSREPVLSSVSSGEPAVAVISEVVTTDHV